MTKSACIDSKLYANLESRDTFARRPLLRNAVNLIAHVHVASSCTITMVTDSSVSRITKYLMTILEHFCSVDIMIRDGSGAAVGQYALAEADSDADVDSNDSRRAVEVDIEDAVAGPDSDSDATPTS